MSRRETVALFFAGAAALAATVQSWSAVNAYNDIRRASLEQVRAQTCNNLLLAVADLQGAFHKNIIITRTEREFVDQNGSYIPNKVALANGKIEAVKSFLTLIAWIESNASLHHPKFDESTLDDLDIEISFVSEVHTIQDENGIRGDGQKNSESLEREATRLETELDQLGRLQVALAQECSYQSE